MTTPAAVWLYAVLPARDSRPTVRTGVAGARVRLVESGPLTAAVGSVPLSDFAEEPLHDHLEDLRWLEETARAHHTVIDTLSRSGDVVPLQFATIYHDDAAVREVLTRRSADFTAALERVRGRSEWGIKAYVDPEAEEEPPQTDGGSPGTAYLLRRRSQRDRREETHTRALRRAGELREKLGALAVRTVRHPPQDARLAGYQGWMIANDSYLVDRSLSKDFACAVTETAQDFPDVRVELSGPWPPYSFVAETAGERGQP